MKKLLKFYKKIMINAKMTVILLGNTTGYFPYHWMKILKI